MPIACNFPADIRHGGCENMPAWIRMSKLRAIVSLAVALLSATVVRTVAQSAASPTATTPTITATHGDASSLSGDLKGVPPEVAKLILNFDTLRDKYLLKQHLLLEKRQNATTQEQRDAIRQQLQDNRQAFLDELADFRTQLKDELKSVKGRVSNAEFLRIIEAAQSGSGGNHHHRGN
jgi:hypothetical protein